MDRKAYMKRYRDENLTVLRAKERDRQRWEVLERCGDLRVRCLDHNPCLGCDYCYKVRIRQLRREICAIKALKTQSLE